MEETNQLMDILENLLIWKRKEHVFWKWMVRNFLLLSNTVLLKTFSIDNASNEVNTLKIKFGGLINYKLYYLFLIFIKLEIQTLKFN